ncbi:GNAT family N-acetyltransferase [Rhizobium sp. XQZ8]|uniref:acyl-homoserine-lactone synthase n=1 Tax=Rhizobium populisoli TaxID=2859785 RepID=UPI001CA53135|nr:GNAT family N-acetyltransferase [Rhizobium populisoli]
MKVVFIKTPTGAAENAILEGIYQLRARIFQDRLNWRVSVIGGRERDRYDDLDPNYIVVLGNADDVIGAARLLPAQGPTMLEETFPYLLQRGHLEAHPRMVESSRFCVDTRTRTTMNGLLHEATLSLFAGIIEWSMSAGYNEIVTATDLKLERLLRRVGWPMQRLGEPRLIDQVESVAGVLPADDASFRNVKPPGYQPITAFSPMPARSQKCR